MKDIKITKDCYLPKENVKFYVAYESRTVKEEVRKKRKEEKVYDFTFGKKNIICNIFKEWGTDSHQYANSNA